jgi:hypothetical protein
LIFTSSLADYTVYRQPRTMATVSILQSLVVYKSSDADALPPQKKSKVKASAEDGGGQAHKSILSSAC